MSNLIVLAFDKQDTGAVVRDRLIELQKEQLISLDDLVLVIRDQSGKINIKQAANLAGAGALSGAFWGMLIGLIFFVPFAGAAIGAATGAVAGHFADYGIDDKFIKSTSEQITPGTSALFVLVKQSTPDKVISALKEYRPKVIHTNLPSEKEQELEAAFAAE